MKSINLLLFTSFISGFYWQLLRRREGFFWLFNYLFTYTFIEVLLNTTNIEYFSDKKKASFNTED